LLLCRSGIRRYAAKGTEKATNNGTEKVTAKGTEKVAASKGGTAVAVLEDLGVFK
jgi:hypothetical protein